MRDKVEDTRGLFTIKSSLEVAFAFSESHANMSELHSLIQDKDSPLMVSARTDAKPTNFHASG